MIQVFFILLSCLMSLQIEFVVEQWARKACAQFLSGNSWLARQNTLWESLRRCQPSQLYLTFLLHTAFQHTLANAAALHRKSWEAKGWTSGFSEFVFSTPFLSWSFISFYFKLFLLNFQFSPLVGACSGSGLVPGSRDRGWCAATSWDLKTAIKRENHKKL